MPLLKESQQHNLQDIREMLVDLRRLVSAHGEFLATFGQQTRSEENSDNLDERSPPQRWSPPPSVTQEPIGFMSYSLPRLNPPRFNGEMALDWICKVQEYYNHHYTPLDDRLYLTKYLFDIPATDWFHSYQKTDIDGSWMDFLVAVRHHFAPELIEGIVDEKQLGDSQFAPDSDDEVSQVIADSQVGAQPLNVASSDIFANENSYKTIFSNGSLNINMESTNIFANGIDFDTMETIYDVDPLHCIGTPKSYTEWSVDADLQLPHCKMDDGNLQVEARHVQGVFVGAATLIDLYGDARAIPPRDDALLLRRNPIIGTALLSRAANSPSIELFRNYMAAPSDDSTASQSSQLSFKIEQRADQLKESLITQSNSVVSREEKLTAKDFGNDDSAAAAVSFSILNSLEPRGLFDTLTAHNLKSVSLDFLGGSASGHTLLGQTTYRPWPDGRSIPPCEHVGRKSSSRWRWRLPPSQTPHPSSSFELLRNCVTDPEGDSLEFSSVVRRRCDPSYYTIYLEETREYKLHEDEHGKDFVQCVAFSNKVRIFFKIMLFKVHELYSLDLDKFSVVDVRSNALYYTKSDLLLKIGLLYLGRLLHSRWNDENRSWHVAWLAPSNECDIYETWGQFGSCYTQALKTCSCLKRFDCQMMNQLQYNVGRPNVQEFRSRCWGSRSCIAYGKVLMYVMIFITWCCIAMVLKHELERLFDAFGQAAQEFKNEVIVVSKLQHNNLVQSLEYGVGKKEKMVIYEFMPHDSLDFNSHFHLEDKVIFNRGGVDRVLDLANLAEDHLQYTFLDFI